MRILNSSVVKSKITNIRVQIYFLAATTFIIQLSTFQGEDIVNARLNYLTGAKTDFWGGASTLVYAHIPSLGIKWQIWLAAAQICCTAAGLILFFKDRMIDKPCD